MLKDICFYNSVPSEVVTIAIIKYLGPRVIAQFMLPYDEQKQIF